MENTTSLNNTLITNDFKDQTKAPDGSNGCFIDPQLAFIVVAASGSLMLVLLISVLVLACKVITLKRQCQDRRPTRSNMDLRGSGHWSTEREEEGIVGPCETSVLLEEVKRDGEEQEEEEEAILHQSNSDNIDEENVLATMQGSTSRDSCIDPAKELENMPLVV